MIDGDAVCPYRGLARFDRSDGERFFGRDEVVARLVAQVERAEPSAVSSR